ncbi:cryptochrome/photolyase family protein [Kocuria sp.]|uniref:cryptochrome/photolyase family protein n=1 Tax=Kocuria sp. TaxID=1871328 RepID=UPI0026DECA01|nr:deoxyribodipyrimidine photo-lyase [Kocuria sp.]MDO5619232.1 deoxyribodipyrimidine photo-lyase [Kocuria sp.]
MTILAVLGMNLRVDDNPALFHAAEQASTSGESVVALVCQDTNVRAPGAAFTWWTSQSLALFRSELESLGIPMLAVSAPVDELIPRLVKELQLSAVHANRRWGESALDVDRRWAETLKEQGITVRGHTAHTLHDPWAVSTGQGGPYRVFTPFSKRFMESEEAFNGQPVGVPEPVTSQTSLFKTVSGLELGTPLESSTEPHWAAKFTWQPGEVAAVERMEDFLSGPVEDYASARDLPDRPGTSGLSPYLAHGEISARRAWEMAQQHALGAPSESAETFKTELLWREFNYHLLYHYPDLHERNLNSRFDAFPWKSPEKEPVADQVALWRSGHTGHPIVDAGMRQLWETGWMHNRVRMVVASLLTKNLGVHWSLGEQWFWDTLVDADPASNPGNWQWASGTGADAAPYFRIFNPRRQAERFDDDATYVRRWVPELAEVETSSIMKLYEADSALPAHADLRPAQTVELYPAPIVDLKTSRADALDAYQSIK